MSLSDLVQKAVYIGIGAASYAGEKAGNKLGEFGDQLQQQISESKLGDFGRQVQKLADEMIERGEMTTEEARRYVDAKMKTTQQEFENLSEQSQQAPKPEDKPKEPRRIEIVDEDEVSASKSNSASSSTAQPEVVKPEEAPKSESSGNPVEDMRRQVAELQEELRRLRS
jgi:polyhydroxyalkanoate synthesis regulator phasin